jgi:hypothetical protein
MSTITYIYIYIYICEAPNVFDVGYEYDPKDMKGQGRTTENCASDCAKRCKEVKDCVHITYFHDGGCHLASGNAQLKQYRNTETQASIHSAADLYADYVKGQLPDCDVRDDYGAHVQGSSGAQGGSALQKCNWCRKCKQDRGWCNIR